MSKLLAILLIFISSFAYAAEDKKPSIVDELYAKTVESNIKDANKAYLAYQKAIEEANKKIIVVLEKTKADLNDTKKFNGMSIADRATLISEVEKKIAIVKDGAISGIISERNKNNDDLLGVGSGVEDINKLIIGKWKWYDGQTVSFEEGGLAHASVEGKWEIGKDGRIVAKWANGTVNYIKVNKDSIEIEYNGVVRNGSRNK